MPSDPCATTCWKSMSSSAIQAEAAWMCSGSHPVDRRSSVSVYSTDQDWLDKTNPKHLATKIRRPRLKEGERARDYRCGSLALLRLSTNLQATDASTARCCSNTCITGAATYCASSSQHEPAGNRRGHCSMLLEHMHQWNRKLQQHTNPSGGGSQCRGRAP